MNPLHKTVDLPIGLSFEIRRLDLFEFMADVGNLPGRVLPAVMAKLKEAGAEEPGPANAKVLTEQRRMMELVLTSGVVAPKIWFGGEAATPEGHIYHADLGIWRWALVQEVVTFSSAAGEVEKFVRFFRGAGAGAAGPDGAALRQDAVGAGGDGT